MPPPGSSSMAPPLLSGVCGVPGGSGWMSLGTMTRSRPSTRMAPALPAQATRSTHARVRERTRRAAPASCADSGRWRCPVPVAKQGARRLARGAEGDGVESRRTCRAAVVGGGEERDEVPLGKALKAVHDALVRAHNHLQPVGLRGAGEEQRAVRSAAQAAGLATQAPVCASSSSEAKAHTMCSGVLAPPCILASGPHESQEPQASLPALGPQVTVPPPTSSSPCKSP